MSVLKYKDPITGEMVPLVLPSSGGGSGEDGGYYIPSVEQTDSSTMTISFTASKSGMNSIEEKAIILPVGPEGPAGQNGHTPVKGTDYFTDSDKEEIVNSVLSSLPIWNGGSY